MPYNGSGTFTLAEAAFVPSTVISSSAMNSDLSDIATNGLTNAVAKDGQTTITGAFKGASGSVGLPMYSFSADTDCGMYRIGANNIGLSVNATKILDIATTGLAVTGTLSSTGTFSPSGVILAGDGTVSLPAYSFTSDPDSGVYRIGANNIGVAVNATKILDISTTGLNVIGTVASNGAVFTPQAQAAGMVNGTIVESHSGNAVTFAVKTLAGADPSATDIVYFVFRNATAATGNYVVLQVTAALNLTVSSGSTLGTSSSNVPFRLWLVAFNDASTVRLGVINCVSGTNIFPLAQFPIASSTAEGGAGGADSAQVFYTGSAVSSKAYSIIGYASYETGVATAGAWASTPTRLQLFGDGIPLPGTPIQTPYAEFLGTTTVAASAFATTGLAQAITLVSACNIVDITCTVGVVGHSGSDFVFFQVVRGSTAIGVGTTAGSRISCGAAVVPGTAGTAVSSALCARDAPGVTSATIYTLQCATPSGNAFINRSGTDTNSSAFPRGASQMTVRELMA